MLTKAKFILIIINLTIHLSFCRKAYLKSLLSESILYHIRI